MKLKESLALMRKANAAAGRMPIPLSDVEKALCDQVDSLSDRLIALSDRLSKLSSELFQLKTREDAA